MHWESSGTWWRIQLKARLQERKEGNPESRYPGKATPTHSEIKGKNCERKNVLGVILENQGAAK